MSQTPQTSLPKDLKRLIDGAGAQITGRRTIDHGTQYNVSLGPNVATVNVYHTGKVVEGGKDSGLKRLLRDYRLARAGGKETAGRPDAAGPVDVTPRVGADEAGKGDYFGPLVVAGARILGEKAALKLREIGVRDSKTLSPLGARSMARRLLDSLGPENTRVVVLGPREYETRRAAAGNINRLLGEINVQIFDELEDEVKVFIVDEFAKAARSYIEPRLPRGVRLVVRPGAEDDAAVAAASVLARARYLEELDALSERVGFELPRGATHVLGAARRVVEERGPEGLAEVAKVHFGTTTRVFEEL